MLRIAASRRRQRVLRLNQPEALIQADSLVPDLARSQLPIRRRTNHVYVYVDHGAVLGYIQAKARWGRRDEWAIITLVTLDRAPHHVPEALLEAVCVAAGEQEVLRIYVKITRDEPGMGLFRGIGFTHYTNENIWGNLYFAASGGGVDEPPHETLHRQSNADAWNLMQLYSAVTPPAVQRAETLNSKHWRRSYMPKPFFSQGLIERAYVWPDLNDKRDGLGGYIRLVSGGRGHWITTMFRPDAANRDVCPAAFDFVLWKASRHGSKPVYCGVRDYQAEIEGILEARGFHHLSEQAMLVKYLAEPIKARQPALAPFLARNTGELVAAE